MIARERQFARAVSSREGEWQRLTALSRLQSGEMRVLCLPADALLWRMTPPEVARVMTVTCLLYTSSPGRFPDHRSPR